MTAVAKREKIYQGVTAALTVSQRLYHIGISVAKARFFVVMMMVLWLLAVIHGRR